MAVNLPTSTLLVVYQLTSLLALVVSISFGKWVFAGIIVLLATLAFTGSFFLTDEPAADGALAASGTARSGGSRGAPTDPSAVDPYVHMQAGDLAAGLAADEDRGDGNVANDDVVTDTTAAPVTQSENLSGIAVRNAPPASQMVRDPMSQFTSYTEAFRMYTASDVPDNTRPTLAQVNAYQRQLAERVQKKDMPFLADL